MYLDESELLTVEEVMDILNVGKNTVYALLNQQKIDAFRIGRTWKIPHAALNTFIKNSAEMKVRFPLK